MKKYILSILSIIVIMSSIGNHVCLAEASIVTANHLSGGDYVDDNPQTAEEQYHDMLNDSNISSEECQKFYNKMFRNVQERSSITMKVLGVPYYRQETNYYCGPATAQQTIMYFNGSAESQEDIWEEVKVETNNGWATQGDKLRTYVNNKQSENTYGLSYPTSATDMSNDIYYDLNLDIPVILWIKITDTSGSWHYVTDNGHFLNASGINTGGSLIQVTDPYIGWVSGDYVTGKYWVTAQEAYSATVERGLGYYY